MDRVVPVSVDVNPYPAGDVSHNDMGHWSLYRKKQTTTAQEQLHFRPSAFHSSFQDRHRKANGVQHREMFSFKEAAPGFGHHRQVTLPNGPNGEFGLYRPDSHFLKPINSRQTFSELDLRKAVLEAPTTRGPYLGQSSRFSNSAENGLDFMNKNNYDSNSTDSHSETDEHHQVKHVFNPHELRQSKLVQKKPSDLGFSGNHGPHNYHSSTQLGGNVYMQNKRHHHRHYFSNLDLFTTSATYNYLRYAKADHTQTSTAKQPHLLARNVGFDRDKRTSFDVAMLRTPQYETVLENISFEMCAGETLAIMYTNAVEVKTLFSVMTNAHKVRGRSDGSFLVNGLPMRAKHLADRIAYVCSHDLCSHLTVREQLRMVSGFVKPASQAFRTRSMISQLIQTLALSAVHDKLIESLSRSERQRVKIGCQILLDTDFLLLDDVTQNTDLYDTAFLIDYLRDWAVKLNRIVIMAINPPTSELLAMFHKVALLASGRLIYFGRSNELVTYFESLSYSCPLFKNPCDYYIDLITHDYLTPEASLESKERIKRLADHWVQVDRVRNDTNEIGMLPPKIRRSNAFIAFCCIYCRFWLILYNAPWRYLNEFACSFCLSLINGLIFYQLTIAKQGGINDRMGLFQTISTVGVLPNLFCNIDRIFMERRMIHQDSLHGLYPKLSFLVAKLCFELPIAILAYALYATPVFFMSRLFAITVDLGQSFAIYLGFVLLQCFSLRMLSWACAYASPSRYVATFIAGVLLIVCSLNGGVTLHPNNGWHTYKISHKASPTFWFHLMMSQYELSSNATHADVDVRQARSSPILFGCDTKEIKYGPIVTTLPCPIVNGDDAVTFANLTRSTLPVAKDQHHYALYYIGLPITVAFSLVYICASCCFVHCFYVPVNKVKRND